MSKKSIGGRGICKKSRLQVRVRQADARYSFLDAYGQMNLTVAEDKDLASAGTSRPVRVAVHPDDMQMRLAGDLHKLLESGGVALSYPHIDIR